VTRDGMKSADEVVAVKAAQMQEDGASLEALLSLAHSGIDRFESRVNQRNRNGNLFGGQLIAQALTAAQMTVEGRVVHSLNIAFQGPSAAGEPMRFHVERSRDGGSFSTRRVTGFQSGSALVSATASFRHQGEGFAHERRWSMTPPCPESLHTVTELDARYGPVVGAHGRGRLMSYSQVELRPVDPPTHLLMERGPAHSRFWIRAVLPRDGDARMNAAALAFLSDYLFVNAALIPHVRELPAERLFVASLNHSMWFHRSCDPREWLLFESESPWAADGHALLQGRFYDRGGRLVASAAQEALIRRQGPRR
jgi:acyl-CoA thioesterase-2